LPTSLDLTSSFTWPKKVCCALLALAIWLLVALGVENGFDF